MHIVLAPIKLKSGVGEEQFLKASDDFETNFVKNQKGIIKRILMKNKDGAYADLVFFEDLEAIHRVVEAEKNSPVCHGFFKLMEEDSGDHMVYEALKTY